MALLNLDAYPDRYVVNGLYVFAAFIVDSGPDTPIRVGKEFTSVDRLREVKLFVTKCVEKKNVHHVWFTGDKEAEEPKFEGFMFQTDMGNSWYNNYLEYDDNMYWVVSSCPRDATKVAVGATDLLDLRRQVNGMIDALDDPNPIVPLSDEASIAACEAMKLIEKALDEEGLKIQYDKIAFTRSLLRPMSYISIVPKEEKVG